jgi:hypothetical protein
MTKQTIKRTGRISLLAAAIACAASLAFAVPASAGDLVPTRDDSPSGACPQGGAVTLALVGPTSYHAKKAASAARDGSAERGASFTANCAAAAAVENAVILVGPLL